MDPSEVEGETLQAKWEWCGQPRNDERGRKHFRSVRRIAPNARKHKIYVGDVVSMRQEEGSKPWIGQILDFYQALPPDSSKLMSLRWFYYPSQVEPMYVESWTNQRGKFDITDNEIMISDNVENEPNLVSTIIGIVLVSQTSKGVLRICAALKAKPDTFIELVRLARFYLAHPTPYNGFELSVRKLERHELSSILKKPNSKFNYDTPMLMRKARKCIDGEAEVSTAIENDEHQALVCSEQLRALRIKLGCMKRKLQNVQDSRDSDIRDMNTSIARLQHEIAEKETENENEMDVMELELRITCDMQRRLAEEKFGLSEKVKDLSNALEVERSIFERKEKLLATTISKLVPRKLSAEEKRLQDRAKVQEKMDRNPKYRAMILKKKAKREKERRRAARRKAEKKNGG